MPPNVKEASAIAFDVATLDVQQLVDPKSFLSGAHVEQNLLRGASVDVKDSSKAENDSYWNESVAITEDQVELEVARHVASERQAGQKRKLAVKDSIEREIRHVLKKPKTDEQSNNYWHWDSNYKPSSPDVYWAWRPTRKVKKLMTQIEREQKIHKMLSAESIVSQLQAWAPVEQSVVATDSCINSYWDE